MNADFFDALYDIEKEKGIPVDYMLDRISQALLSAYKKDTSESVDNVFVEPDLENKVIRMYVRKTVVEEVTDPALEISVESAAEISKRLSVGDHVDIEVETKRFGRIAAQTAKQVIIQGIREAERGLIYQEFTSKEHELITAVVTRIDQRNGNAYLEINGKGGHSEAVLLASEQIAGEELRDGDHLKVYVVDVRNSSRGPQILISRTHPGLVKRLFELEVPENHDGIVEISSIAREAGMRTKIAVHSNDEDVDPIGACIGPRGSRVESIVDELRGEKIDIVRYSDNPEEYIASALSPATVISVTILEDAKSCQVIVPDDQLSLAIGREGQNARLAARLTGYKIDIKPASQSL